MAKTKSWHLARWPALGWIETGVKLVAIWIGLIAGIRALTVANFALPAGPQLAQLIVLALLSLGLAAAIFDRVADREIVAMIFVVLNNLGHWGMVLFLASATATGLTIWLFAGLMLLGDLVKLLFIKVEQFTVRNYSQRLLYGLTLVYVFGYALLLLLEWTKSP